MVHLLDVGSSWVFHFCTLEFVYAIPSKSPPQCVTNHLQLLKTRSLVKANVKFTNLFGCFSWSWLLSLMNLELWVWTNYGFFQHSAHQKSLKFITNYYYDGGKCLRKCKSFSSDTLIQCFLVAHFRSHNRNAASGGLGINCNEAILGCTSCIGKVI